MKTITFITPKGSFRYHGEPHIPDIGEKVKLTSGIEGKDSGDSVYIVKERIFTYGTGFEKIDSHIEIILE